MPVTDSRLGPGTLTFSGPHDFSAQVASCSLTPTVNETDGTPTLGTPDPASEVTFDWALTGTAISDWGNANGFVNHCMDNAGTSVTFTFTPSTADGIDYTGTCQIRPMEIGGDVASQSVVSFEFPVIGDVTRTV